MMILRLFPQCILRYPPPCRTKFAWIHLKKINSEMKKVRNASRYHGYEICTTDSGLDYFQHENSFLQNMSLF